MDKRDGRSRGFGFVVMGSAAEAEKLVGELNGQDVHGCVLRISIAHVDAKSDTKSESPEVLS
jgi:RNA recognition motif-containing protein